MFIKYLCEIGAEVKPGVEVLLVSCFHCLVLMLNFGGWGNETLGRYYFV